MCAQNEFSPHKDTNKICATELQRENQADKYANEVFVAWRNIYTSACVGATIYPRRTNNDNKRGVRAKGGSPFY